VTNVEAPPVSEEGTCSRQDCPANDAGECVLGHELIDCEFYELTETDEPEPDEPETRAVVLPTGEALRADELEQVLADGPASMVVPLGIVAAGKTTLLCLIFDQVRMLEQSPWRFAKSRTVLGFARRSHEASIRSGRVIPTTPRTRRGDSGLHLHLGMRHENGTEAPIVFVDLSGEHVAALADGKIEPVVAKSLKRADHIPIVINGRDIADPDRRALAIYEGRSLLGMVERQVRPQHASVFVVVTKGDLLVGADMDKVFSEITLGTVAEGSPAFVTADRESPPDGGNPPAVERGLGVDALLAHIAQSPASPLDVAWPTIGRPEPSRMLARLWGAE
jgi:hypothetical protein